MNAKILSLFLLAFFCLPQFSFSQSSIDEHSLFKFFIKHNSLNNKDFTIEYLCHFDYDTYLNLRYKGDGFTESLEVQYKKMLDEVNDFNINNVYSLEVNATLSGVNMEKGIFYISPFDKNQIKKNIRKQYSSAVSCFDKKTHTQLNLSLLDVEKIQSIQVDKTLAQQYMNERDKVSGGKTLDVVLKIYYKLSKIHTVDQSGIQRIVTFMAPILKVDIIDKSIYGLNYGSQKTMGTLNIANSQK